MNEAAKRSYIQFLALYLFSSLTLLLFASYYFYTSKRALLIQSTYYKMHHIADMQGLAIIDAHMHKKPFKLLEKEGCTLSLYDANETLRYGMPIGTIDFQKDFTTLRGVTTVVSQSSAMHLGIKYVVVQTRSLTQALAAIKRQIVTYTIAIAGMIAAIAAVLSWIFLKPIRQKAKETQRFVRDMTHELNTPVSALMMSMERLRDKKTYDANIIDNMIISVKNLKDMYEALTYITFTKTSYDETTVLDLEEIVRQQVRYFEELTRKKRIRVEVDTVSVTVKTAPMQAKMLVSNLLSNAIKYSRPESTIRIELTPEYLRVADSGIGISQEAMKEIFEKFRRANDYAGGFGLGLSIVDEIAQRYGFRIEIESQPTQGTTVTVRF